MGLLTLIEPFAGLGVRQGAWNGSHVGRVVGAVVVTAATPGCRRRVFTEVRTGPIQKHLLTNVHAAHFSHLPSSVPISIFHLSLPPFLPSFLSALSVISERSKEHLTTNLPVVEAPLLSLFAPW